MVRIVGGSNTEELAGKVSEILGGAVIGKSVKKFPDGESYIRLEDTGFEGEKVYVIQTLFPDQNESLIELFMTINAVKENGGIPVAVIPYFAYGRQDMVFEKGEAFSLKVIASILKALGTEMVITVDAHFHRKGGDHDMFGLHVKNISAVKKLRNHFGNGFTVVGPDEGSRNFLSPLEGSVFLKKTKKIKETNNQLHYKINVESKDVKGGSVLLMDDIISGGGTIISAAKALKEQGKKVSVACVHGLFMGDSLKKLSKYADEIVSTDTIKSPCSVVSVADLIAREISE